ncbi:MAG TPA: threonine/serine exporter family protein [Candidatus Ruthenibacterium merdigallinarum]|nr:threonine/serine exporter family protein [Candidatus Ruthenibacterium merdigallinarum]
MTQTGAQPLAAQSAAPDQQRILRFVVEAGETLLENGGEIYRVQDTMERMARALGARDFHVYVLTNGLFASIGGQPGAGCAVRAVPQAATHLGRVAAVNALSRDIAAGRAGLEQASARLAQIRRIPYERPAARIAACAVGTACFAYLFGGSPTDAAAALVAGLALEPARIGLERARAGKFIANLLAAVLVALVSLLLSCALGAAGVGTNLDKIIIGGIIPLVPGIALTTGIRDIAGGDYLSGTIRMVDALLIAAAIALGVGFVLLAGVWLGLPMTGVAV